MNEESAPCDSSGHSTTALYFLAGFCTQTEFENNGVYFSYNLINIKNMSMLKLLEKDTLITDLLLLKKCEGNIKSKMLEILMEDTRNVNKYYIYKKIKDAENEIKLK